MVALANLQSREGSSLCRALAIALMGTTLLIALEANAEDVKPAELADEVDFARDILPILQKRCLSCHGDKARGGLRLTSRMAALEGGDRRGIEDAHRCERGGGGAHDETHAHLHHTHTMHVPIREKSVAHTVGSACTV